MTREALKLPRASPRMSSGRFATFAKGRSHFPFWPKIEPKLGVHRYLMKDFPYAIPFIIEPASIHIIAFAHLRWRPGYWVRRVQSRRHSAG